MHRVIRVLVFAPDANSALDAAHDVVHETLKTASNGGPFDYYVDFTDCPRKEPGTIAEEMVAAALNKNGVSTLGLFGKSRYGPIPPVLQVSTLRFPIEDTRGMEQARAAFELIRKRFKDRMAQIRYLVANYTDDELFGEVEGRGKVEIDGVQLYDDPRSFQYYCECVGGQIPGYLFGFTGSCITRIEHFQRIITDSDENPFYIDESEGQNPKWHKDMWNQPLWIVPFDVHY